MRSWAPGLTPGLSLERRQETLLHACFTSRRFVVFRLGDKAGSDYADWTNLAVAYDFVLFEQEECLV